MAVGGIQGASAASPLAAALARITRAVTFDARDTNQDGVVSPAEQITYDLKHPSLSARTGSRFTQYAPRGRTAANGASNWGSLDLLA